MEKVTGLDEPAVTTTAIMGRPLNGFKFPCASPENVMDEAYVDGDGVNCVVRQICAKYDLPRCEVEAEFDQISETIQPDREEGMTAVQILEWCKRHSINGYIVWNSALIAKHDVAERDHHLESLCVQVVGYHAYVMKDGHIWKTHERRRCNRPCPANSMSHPNHLRSLCSKSGRTGSIMETSYR